MYWYDKLRRRHRDVLFGEIAVDALRRPYQISWSCQEYPLAERILDVTVQLVRRIPREERARWLAGVELARAA